MKHSKVWLSALLGWIVLCGSVGAATLPEVSRGLAWLSGQVRADGSLAGERGSLAGVMQAREESFRFLQQTSPLPDAAIDALLANVEDNTEFVARKLVVAGASGRSTQVLSNLLLGRQSTDGGVGAAPGYPASTLDTIWALLALRQSGQGAAAPAAAARQYLIQAIQLDGSLSGTSEPERVQACALALLALQGGPADVPAANAIRRLTEWLLGRQGLDGAWLSDAYLTALAHAAIAPSVSDPVARGKARLYLLSLQAADGSWSQDPFLTAVVLRALSLEPSAAPSLTAGVVGRVIDQAGGSTLAGVAISVSGPASASAISDSAGGFTVTGLPGGTYALSLRRNGYAPAGGSLTVREGQTLNVGVIALTTLSGTGIVRGRVTAAAGGAPMPGVTVALSGGATLSTLTDAAGQFEFTEAPPGALGVSASAVGYRTASVGIQLTAGQTSLISLALERVTDPAATNATLRGKVAAQGTGAALSGVLVDLGAGAGTTTVADGRFEITLPPGSYTARYSLAGYHSASQSVALTTGSTSDAGLILLSQQRTSTALRGTIFDRASGRPLGGAQIQLIGGQRLVSGSDGAYRFDGLTGTSFDLRIGASGYVSQLFTLQVPRPAEVVQDFGLDLTAAGTLALSVPEVAPPAVRSRAQVNVQTIVANTGTDPRTATALLLVADAQGTLIAQGAAFAPGGTTPLGPFTLDPGDLRTIELRWNSAQFPPGGYALTVRLVEPDTLNQGDRLGTALAERSASVDVLAELRLAGAVTVDPPVLRADIGVPVKLSAVIQNDGNAPLPAQPYRLDVIDTRTDAVISTQTAPGDPLVVSALQTLTFADWLPARGSDYRIELQSPDPAQGRLQTQLYVGDAPRATFTLARNVVPAGTQAVRANLRTQGQDVATGAASDPLAPLVRNAVQKAVAYADSYAYSHMINDLRCYACHVQTQALVGGELSRRFAPANELARRTLLNTIMGRKLANGAVDGTAATHKASTTLALWGLNVWADKTQVVANQVEATRYLRSQQEANGAWFSDHFFAWWTQPVALAGLNVKSFVELHRQLGATSQPVVQYASTPWPYAAGISDLFVAVGADPQGNVYTIGYNGTLQRTSPDGTRDTIATGLPPTQGMSVTADGTIYLATYSGTYRRTPPGVVTKLSPQGGAGVAVMPDGSVMVANYDQNAIFRVAPDGTTTKWLSGNATLQGPWGLAADGEDLYVASHINYKLLRVRPDKTIEEVLPFTSFRPRNIARGAGRWWVTTDFGLFAYDDRWVGSRLTVDPTFGLTALPDGGVLFTRDSTISTLRTSTVDIATERAALDASIRRATTWLLVDSNTDSGDNLSLAHRLIGMSAARQYYEGQALASSLQSKMEQVGATLRARQLPDGGWPWRTQTTSDSLVTAQVGYALDALNPLPSSPEVRKAVQLLLSRQRPDGTWVSENGVSSVPLIASTWVEIWLPVTLDRLGGIDTDVTLAFPANVALSQPSLPPAAVLDNALGGKSWRWRLSGVTAVGRDLDFDLTFADLAPGESRPAAADARLTFNNSFTQQPVEAPVPIPSLSVSAFLDVSASTDRLVYAPGQLVDVQVNVANAGQADSAGEVRAKVFSAGGALISELGRMPFTALPAGAQRLFTQTWSTGERGPGAYYVLAELYDSQGRHVGSGRADLSIDVGAAGSGPTAASIGTDRARYLPADLVQLRGRLINTAVNAPLQDMRITTTVADSAGSVIFNRTETLAELAPRALRDYEYALALGLAAPGSYTARFVVRGTLGMPLAAASAPFEILSSAQTGTGLTGSVSVAPKTVPIAESALLSLSASNGGNAAIPALTLRLRVVDPRTSQLVTEYAFPSALGVGESTHAGASWVATGAPGTTYVVALVASVGGNTVLLAQDRVTVIAPPVKLEVTHDLARDARMLVLASCRRGSSGDDDEDRHDHDEDRCTDSTHNPGASEDLRCAAQKAQFLRDQLAGLGVENLVVTRAEEFRRELRCGRYNVAWVSGGAGKLDSLTAKALRESVYRGNALLLDGAQGERDGALDEVAGARYKGHLSGLNRGVALSGALFQPIQLSSRGAALRLEAAGGAVQATFVEGGTPAVMTREYGLGRGVIAAFDLADTLKTYAGTTAWREVLSATLGYLQPAMPTSIVEGSYVPLATRIINAGQTAQLGVRLALPSATGLLSSAPVADVAGGEARWQFGLSAAQSQSLRLGLRLPLGAQTFDFSARVELVRNGQPQPFASYPLQVRTVGLDTLTSDAQTALASLSPAGAAERQKASAARRDLDDARNALAREDYGEAVEELIDAVDSLRGVTSVPVEGARLAVDRVLEAAQLRWCRAQCNPSAPRAHHGKGFTPFDPLERLEVRSGRPSGADWEWGLGVDAQQAGSFVQQNLDWVSGRTYKWTLSYDGQGGGTFTVWHGSTQLFTRTHTGRAGPLHAGNTLKFYVKASDGTGSARIEATVDTIAGKAAKAQLATAGNDKFSEAAAYSYYPPMTSGFTASGTVKLTFPGSAPPQGSRLNFTVTSGNVSCTQ